MYIPRNLNLDRQSVAHLLKGGAVRVTRDKTTGSTPVHLTATQARRVDGVKNGSQGHMTLKMTPSHVTHELKNNPFFKKIWESIKSGLSQVSNIASPHVKKGIEHLTNQAINAVANQYAEAHPSMNLMSSVSHLRKGKGTSGKGTRSYNSEVNDVLGSRQFYNAPYNNDTSNVLGARLGSQSIGDYNNDVENYLSGMGFKKKHIKYMRGSGVFKSLWSGTKSLAKFLLPIVGSQIAGLAVKKVLGGKRKKKHYTFTLAQRKHIYGNGFFSDIWGKIKDFVKKPSNIVGLIPTPIPGLSTVASLGLKAIGKGRKRARGLTRLGGELNGGNAFTDFFTKTIPGIAKDTFTKPSGILGAISMIPSPLSGPLKLASLGAKISGNGRSKHRRYGKGLYPLGQHSGLY